VGPRRVDPIKRRARFAAWLKDRFLLRFHMAVIACMFVAAVAFGLVANDLCPDARRMVDVVVCAQR